MTVKIARKGENDTNDRMISRFKKSIREARYWQEMKTSRYFKKKPSKRLLKVKALVREGFRKENAKKELYAV